MTVATVIVFLPGEPIKGALTQQIDCFDPSTINIYHTEQDSRDVISFRDLYPESQILCKQKRHDETSFHQHKADTFLLLGLV
jgi:hypothetical protein